MPLTNDGRSLPARPSIDLRGEREGAPLHDAGPSVDAMGGRVADLDPLLRAFSAHRLLSHAHAFMNSAFRLRSDSLRPTDEHERPRIELDLDDYCPGEGFTGTVTVTGAGGRSVSNRPLSVALAIDATSSMCGENLSRAKFAIERFLERMEDEAPGSSVAGLVGFGSGAVHPVHGLRSPKELLYELSALECHDKYGTSFSSLEGSNGEYSQVVITGPSGQIKTSMYTGGVQESTYTHFKSSW